MPFPCVGPPTSSKGKVANLEKVIVNLHLSALAGLGLLVIGFASLIGTVGMMFRQRKAIDETTETRVSLTQEVLDAVRLVKYFRWEAGYVLQFKSLRSQETRKLQRYTAMRNGVGAVSQGLPVLTGLISFITYALTNLGLSPALVFSSAALFTSLRMPLIYLPICMQGCIDSAASLRSKNIHYYLILALLSRSAAPLSFGTRRTFGKW